MSERTLKPCPFCGGNPQTIDSIDSQEELHGITCSECDSGIGFVSSASDAAELWNRAPRSQPLVVPGKRHQYTPLGYIPDFIRAEALKEIRNAVEHFCEALEYVSSDGELCDFCLFEIAEELDGLSRLQWALAVHRGEQP